MPAKLAEADQMTIEEFLAFYESRPDGQRWELIEGAAVMSPAPTEWHQVIAGNILIELGNEKASANASWLPMLGVGMRVPVSPNSLPQPDVFVKSTPAADSHISDDALILFEILSPSNTRADRAWRKRVYASVPNCRHYVTVSTTQAEAERYDRADGWQGVTMNGLDATLSLPAIAVETPIRAIYRWTPIT